MRVIITKRDSLAREAIERNVRERFPNWSVQAFGHATAAIAECRRDRFDVGILATDMPDVDGPEYIRSLAALGESARIAILCDRSDYRILQTLQDVRYHALLDAETATLVELELALNALLESRQYVSPNLVHVIANLRNGSHKMLSPREERVLALLGDGFDNAAVAERLAISPETVRTHRGAIMRKLNLHSSAALVRYAFAHGYTRRLSSSRHGPLLAIADG